MAEKKALKKFEMPEGGVSNSETAFKARDFVKDLRSKLDAGEISVSEFLEFGQPAAEIGIRSIGTVAGQGSNAANLVNPLTGDFARFGFKHIGGTVGNPELQPDLPQEFEQEVRRELIPDNITGEERQFLEENIPFDIPIDSDRFNVERERVRQLLQGRRFIEEQRGQRASRLGDLSSLLASEQERIFEERQPLIEEGLQTRGLLRSSELGRALADQRSRLTSIREAGLAQQALSDREAALQQEAALLSGQQNLQLAGLQRQFSLQDFQQQAQLAQLLGSQAQPDVGEDGGFNLGGAVTGGAVGTGVGLAMAPATGGASIAVPLLLGAGGFASGGLK